MKHLKNRSLQIIGGVFLIIMGLSFIPYQSALTFSIQRSDELIAYTPISIGDSFQIIYTHSIHLTDVEEFYQVTNEQKIRQYEMSFDEFGIGMPSSATGDQELVIENGRYHLKNMNVIHSYLPIRIADVVPEQRLVWNEGDQQIWFNDYFEPRSYITIELKSLNVWQVLRGVELSEHE
ncbi:DUF1850 domain-containing protein [Bacillus sp. Marseille-P3800]|uniref:DUF1850 domain-containing protein n=1 Tax=Bacillus sp. Marseille-P3800 TaxID=2014782 RepID=UPI00159BA267|nr:DUF1850 domain-containing protein [Bacillus sp. Marseille-P3800]